MLMHKHFSIPVLMTREAVGKTSPNKHETAYGVQYPNLCIVGLDPKYNTDRTTAEESDERLCVHYMYLTSILSTHPDSKVKKRHTCKKKTTKAGTKLHKAQRANNHKLDYRVLDASL